MKKIMITLLSVSAALFFATAVWAGPFEHFYDYQNPDGTYAYYLETGEHMQSVFITLDKDWYRHTRVLLEDGGASFYHRDSYKAYAEEGMKGGWLFTIGACVNSDFQDLPSFEYIGFDDENAMNYYAELPTDYQAYMGDDGIRAEYDELWAGVKDVISGISIGSKPDQVKISETKEIIESGDYSYWVNDDGASATIAKYLADKDDTVAEIPSEIDGYQVTEIGPQAFFKKMKSVIIPDTVKTVGQRAFEYSIITDTLEIPEDVRLCSRSFSDTMLPSVLTLPARVEIEDSAFGYCDTIEQVEIGPDCVVHGRAFGYCDKLEKVIIGEGSFLESRAFEYCKSLREVVFCGPVEMEEDAFSYCGDIEFTQLGEMGADQLESDSSADVVSYGGLAGGQVTGGWTVTGSSEITDEEMEVFNQAVQDIDDVYYEPVALLATQVVAGMNYCFLAREISYEDPENPFYEMVYIWQAPGGYAQVLETQDIEFGLKDRETVPSFSDEHQISLEDDSHVVTDCPQTARAGDKVTIQAMDMADGEVVIEVNGSNSGTWEDLGVYTFTMPDEDVEILAEISTAGYSGA